MCGIVGYVGTEVRAADAAALLRRMCGTLAHRGPDGEGVHVGVGVGLGHRRLSVIDLSAGAAQPMASAGGSSETPLIMVRGETGAQSVKIWSRASGSISASMPGTCNSAFISEAK